MLMFMEGLPGAGKSYETAVFYILEALKQGRPVDAYIEGLNFQQFADLAEKPVEEVRDLLRFVPKEFVPEIEKHARKDALIVIDELQDFFPSGRQKLSDGITTFVTQHRHEGQDIITMGQNLNDCHNLWKRRVDKKFVFQKQDVVGRPDSYTWTAYKAQLNGKDIKFIKVSSGTRKYEEKYFGLYKSHSDGTSNFETFKDDRVNIWNNKSLRYGVPAAAFVGIYAIFYLVTTVFSSDAGLVNTETVTKNNPSTADLSAQFESQKASVNQKSQSVTVTEPPTVSTPAPDPDAFRSSPTEYIAALAVSYRLRLSGSITRPKTGETVYVIEAYDNSYRLKERLLSTEVVALGWEINPTDYGVSLVNDDREYVVRPWPLEPFGAVSHQTANAL